MFAVVQTGGKQYKVCEGDVIDVEKLDLEVGATTDLDVLLVCDENNTKAGNPLVEGVVCKAEVVEHGKGEKIVVFKYKPKKNYKRKQGHRQPYTRLKIVSIK